MKNQPMTNSQPQPTPEQQLASLRQQHQAVSELLWETIHTLAPETHEAVVLPHASNPLWELCFVRVEGADGKPDPSGKMRICAATVPELTEQDKKRLVRMLRGTDMPLVEALAKLQLPQPPTYVEQKLSDRIKWDGNLAKQGEQGAVPCGSWISVTPPTLEEKIKNAVHWPK